MGTQKKEKNAYKVVLVLVFDQNLLLGGGFGRRADGVGVVGVGVVVWWWWWWFGRGDGLVQRDLRQHEERGLRDQMRMLQSGDRGNWIPIRRDTRADDYCCDTTNLERRDGRGRREETREVSIEIRRTVRGETAS